jgi:hypothetical protein
MPSWNPKRLRGLRTPAGSLLLALFFAATTFACGHPVKRKLEGRWLGEGVENFDDDKVAAATGWAKGTSMEFSGSTLTVSIPAEEPRSGAYEIVKVHQNDVEISIVRPDGSRDRTHFRLDDEHSMRWMLDEGRAIVLRREGT